jgi:subtilisin family serine protease
VATPQVPAEASKLQPKLRMLANGSTAVNARRAEHAAAVKVSPEVAKQVAPARAGVAAPLADGKTAIAPKTLAPDFDPDASVAVFVRLTAGTVAEGIKRIPGRRRARADMLTAELSVAEARALRQHEAVAFVELGQPLSAPRPRRADTHVSGPSKTLRSIGNEADHGYGKDILIGLIDVQGFDFAHADFLSGGDTRFDRIWDQGGDTRDPPKGFGYGAELRHEHLQAALAAGKLPATLYEAQSEMVEGSHGTHVASIAAGNRGVCRNATIAAVLIALPDSDQERRLSFYDSTRLAHAVDYLLEAGEELGKPVSINISLGTNGHAHDDSAPVNRWIDLALTEPGRSVCVAAGNAGQERGETEDDLGWLLGRVHTEGRMPARGLAVDIEWNVVGNTIADVSENELELWYGAQDRFAVQVKPPGLDWTEPVEPGQYIENRQLPDSTFLSIYNEIYHPANGSNYISIYLSPQLEHAPLVGVRPGQWLVRVIGREVRDGRFHAWLERDDPGQIGDSKAWRFPSFFSEHTMVDKSTISTLACGRRIVAVANLDEQSRRISISSSQGPTRDGGEKPDLAAPGTGIVAAKGFAGADEWIAMSGTSMASPYVAGVVGLMLAVNTQLTGAQITGILKRTANPLPGASFDWRDDAGFGQIDGAAAIREAATMRNRTDITKPAPQ